MRVDPAVIDAAVAEVVRREPRWSDVTLQMPRAEGAPIALSVSTGGTSPASRSQATVDATTGTVTQWRTPSGAPLAQRVRTWIRFGHTGEAWGVPGQFLAAISCLGGALLVWSGLSLAVRRLKASLGRRSRYASDASSLRRSA